MWYDGCVVGVASCDVVVMVGREGGILGGVGGGTLVTVASASTLQTGLLQRCVISRRGGGGRGPSEQLGEPCMRCVRTGVTGYGPGRKVSPFWCFSDIYLLQLKKVD